MEQGVNQSSSLQVYRSSLSFMGLALVFFVFFQVNKWGPLREVNPFGEDPYDAVGSFAFQAALLAGLLSYARALRLLEQPGQMDKVRLILRGEFVVWVAILITLLADAIAVAVHPPALSAWGSILLAEVGGMFMLAIASGIALARASGQVHAPPPPPDLTPADALDDLWTLIRWPANRFRTHLPAAIVSRVTTFSSDQFFSRMQWINPRTHPWRFAGAAGLLAGALLFLAQLREGLPPTVQIGLLLALIFTGLETTAALLGFALLGGYLGLRPARRVN